MSGMDRKPRSIFAAEMRSKDVFLINKLHKDGISGDRFLIDKKWGHRRSFRQVKNKL